VQSAGKEREAGHKRGKTRKQYQARKIVQRASSAGKVAHVKSLLFFVFAPAHLNPDWLEQVGWSYE